MQSAESSAPRLVGREVELARLSVALDLTARGRGAAVLVRGETGIGKSRLLRELGDRARARGVRTLWGRAAEGGGAYRPLAEALAATTRGGLPVRPEVLGPYAGALTRLLPDWPGGAGAPAPDADPAVLLGEAVARLLAELGREHGCLVLLEDLHWADGDSLDVLAYLARAVTALPVALVMSARDDIDAEPLRGLERADGVERLDLGRLTDTEVLSLAASLHGVLVDEQTARLVVARSDGLPLLVEELVHATVVSGADPEHVVPPSLAELVRERLDDIPSAEREVLAAAAVLDEIDPAVLGRAVGRAEEQVVSALRLGARARLLRREGAGLTWWHALTRDAVLRTLLPPEHQLLARRTATALLDRGARDDEARAVELLRRAGASGEVVDLMLDLAARAQQRGALRTAEQLLDHVEQTGLKPALLATARIRLVTSSGRPDDALALGEELLDTTTGDEHAELALQLARTAVRAGRWQDAVSYVERAARPDDARSHAALADAAHGRGDVAAAAEHADRAVHLASADADPEARCEALVIRAKVHRIDDLAAAAADFRLANEVATREGLASWRVEALIGLGSLELLTTEATPTLLEARRLAVAAGLLGQAAGADVLLLDHLLLSQGPQAAAPAASDLLSLARTLRLGYPEGVALHMLALADVATGRRADLGGPAMATAAPEARGLENAVRAYEALQGHDLPGAAELLDRFVMPLVDHAPAAPLHHFGLWALLRTVVDRDAARARTTLLALPAGLRLANRGQLAYAEAVAAGRAGEPAAVLLEDAERLLAPLPWLRSLARGLTLECALADGWGDPVPLLRVTLAEHEERGEEPFARTCRDLLRRAGAPTRRGRGSSAVPEELRRLGVTSREMDVLLQVAAGASNAAIAERLFLSPRTVETHVASLLRRTGAADRHELARYVDPRSPSS